MIRCRLSDGSTDAVELSAQDGDTLADGCARAFRRYVERHGESTHGQPVTLELQVRPAGSLADERAGWFAPVRNRRPVRVFVSRAILAQRPADEWEAIWTWVAAERADDEAFRRTLDDAREFGLFDATRDDEDDDAR